MHDFSHKIYFYCWKKLKKMHFHSNWLDHLLLMMSYLLTIATDHKLVPKTARGMNEQLLWKRQVLMFYTLGKNRRNLMTLGGGGGHLPPPPLPSPLHVQGLIATSLLGNSGYQTERNMAKWKQNRTALAILAQSMDHAQQLAIWSANLVLHSSTSQEISALLLKVLSGFFVSSETLELTWWVRPECFRK